MKRLIVNGDDFGASHGVNRGVVDAHNRGILTSASMMVDSHASADAAELAAGNPALDVGLHVVLKTSASSPPEAEVERQLERFIELSGRPPTHIDSHHNVHLQRGLLAAFRRVAERHGLPLRGQSAARPIARFYGQWSDGTTDLDSISPAALARIAATEVADGFNELCCHPGYVDGELASSYTVEREAEVKTLCDPAVTALLDEHDIRLATFADLPRE
jgi:chitin disaccharide deacetylase